MSRINRRAFMSGTLACVASPSAFAGNPSDCSIGSSGAWENWSKTLRFKPSGFVRARSVEEVIKAVQCSRKLKAVGSGHSFSDAALTDGTVLSLERMNQVLSWDRDRKRVTVQGGLTIREGMRELARQGVALPSLGNSFYQSFAGAVSTSTHGSGIAWGTLSDAQGLVEIELVDGRGELRSFSADKPEDAHLLAAARVSMGALGVITSVTFGVVDDHNLAYRSWKGDVGQALDSAMWADNDHYEFYWFPYTEDCLLITRNITEEKRNKSGPLRDWWNEWVLEYVGLQTLLKPVIRHPEKSPKIMANLAKMASGRALVDRWDRVMTNPRYLRGVDMEYALPIERVNEAFSAVRDTVSSWASRGEGYLHIPVQFRFVRADQGTYLSTAQGRDTAYIDIGALARAPLQEPLFRELEQKLYALGGRPHWGKLFWKNPKAAYPDFERWDEARRELDPEDKFMNPYVNRLLDGKDRR
jgi:L-gulono-1,4-lactone dehydrogenase